MAETERLGSDPRNDPTDELARLIAAFGDKHDHETGDSDSGWFSYACVCSPRDLAEWLLTRGVRVGAVAPPGAEPGLET